MGVMHGDKHLESQHCSNNHVVIYHQDLNVQLKILNVCVCVCHSHAIFSKFPFCVFYIFLLFIAKLKKSKKIKITYYCTYNKCAFIFSEMWFSNNFSVVCLVISLAESSQRKMLVCSLLVCLCCKSMSP